MSALTMILTMAMVVPGNGPERDSGEVEQRLNLRGKWRGTLRTIHGTTAFVSFNNGRVTWLGVYARRKLHIFFNWNCQDRGQGKLRFDWLGRQQLGIYRQDPDRLIVCFRNANEGSPTSFRCGDGQVLLILHRIKSDK